MKNKHGAKINKNKSSLKNKKILPSQNKNISQDKQKQKNNINMYTLKINQLILLLLALITSHSSARAHTGQGCPVTHGDSKYKDRCLAHSGCAWSTMSGCRDWWDRTFCSKQSHSKEGCLEEVIYHGGNNPYTQKCSWWGVGMAVPHTYAADRQAGRLDEYCYLRA